MNPGSTDNKGSQPGTSDLANRLMSFTYREVFQAANEDVLDAIWNGSAGGARNVGSRS